MRSFAKRADFAEVLGLTTYEYVDGGTYSTYEGTFV